MGKTTYNIAIFATASLILWHFSLASESPTCSFRAKSDFDCNMICFGEGDCLEHKFDESTNICHVARSSGKCVLPVETREILPISHIGSVNSHTMCSLLCVNVTKCAHYHFSKTSRECFIEAAPKPEVLSFMVEPKSINDNLYEKNEIKFLPSTLVLKPTTPAIKAHDVTTIDTFKAHVNSEKLFISFEVTGCTGENHCAKTKTHPYFYDDKTIIFVTCYFEGCRKSQNAIFVEENHMHCVKFYRQPSGQVVPYQFNSKTARFTVVCSRKKPKHMKLIMHEIVAADVKNLAPNAVIVKHPSTCAKLRRKMYPITYFVEAAHFMKLARITDQLMDIMMPIRWSKLEKYGFMKIEEGIDRTAKLTRVTITGGGWFLFKSAIKRELHEICI